jgi:hypothetical protein
LRRGRLRLGRLWRLRRCDLGLGGRRLLPVLGRLLPLVLELERFAITLTQGPCAGLTIMDPTQILFAALSGDARVQRVKSELIEALARASLTTERSQPENTSWAAVQSRKRVC